MTEAELEKRLVALLKEAAPPSDPVFVDRVVLAARLDRQIQLNRRRAWRRTLAECVAGIAIAVAFYLLSQEQPPLPDGTVSLVGPAMAGLIMLALWAVVALPSPNYAPAAS